MSSTSMPKIPEFTLDTASGVPFYRQIIRRIADAVLAGTLPPGPGFRLFAPWPFSSK